MNEFILYPHAGSGNHGCEALVRTTARIMGGTPENMTLFSRRPEEDRSVGLEGIVTVKGDLFNKPLSRKQKLVSAIRHKLSGTDDQFYRYKNATLTKAARSGTVALSIGGDNYCYGAPEWIYSANRVLQEKGAQTVLWGCSVEPDDMDATMMDDLRSHTLITARESITYLAMLEKGLTNVALYPDPAFQLETQELALPDGFKPGNTIGINVSPLIMRYEKCAGSVLRAYDALLKHILDTTDVNVALIPHVTWAANNDLEPLGELYDSFKSSGRVVLIEDHNAMELKGFIARCRMFIGARTHSTIAAYSSCVPTLVIGYSIKARGIARDIFGSEEGLLLPVQELEEPMQLIGVFETFKEREADLRQHLEKGMPGYASRAVEARDAVESALEIKRG